MYQIDKVDKRLLGPQIKDELMNYILKEPVKIGKSCQMNLNWLKNSGWAEVQSGKL